MYQLLHCTLTLICPSHLQSHCQFSCPCFLAILLHPHTPGFHLYSLQLMIWANSQIVLPISSELCRTYPVCLFPRFLSKLPTCWFSLLQFTHHLLSLPSYMDSRWIIYLLDWISEFTKCTAQVGSRAGCSSISGSVVQFLAPPVQVSKWPRRRHWLPQCSCVCLGVCLGWFHYIPGWCSA